MLKKLLRKFFTLLMAARKTVPGPSAPPVIHLAANDQPHQKNLKLLYHRDIKIKQGIDGPASDIFFEWMTN